MSRAGIGYDLHRLEAGRKLIVGGVEVPYDKGPAGHSDGDVLAHAITDALLGAAGLGDIGSHFPNTDPRYKGISSLILLPHVAGLLGNHRWSVVNVDATVILEAPKIAPHVEAMRQTIARALTVTTAQVAGPNVENDLSSGDPVSDRHDREAMAVAPWNSHGGGRTLVPTGWS